MGTDPETSVAGPWGELHDTPGVWIGDAQRVPDRLGHQPDDLDHGPRPPHRGGDRRRAPAAAAAAAETAATTDQLEEETSGDHALKQVSRAALHRRRVGRPGGRGPHRGDQPDHRGADGLDPGGHPRGRRPRGRRGPRRLRGLVADTRASAAPSCWARSPPASSERGDEIAATISAELGMPLKLSRRIQAGLPTMTFGSMPQLIEEVAWEEQVGNSLIVREPIGVLGRDHALELPPAPDRRQGRAGARRRLHGGAEAERGGAAERLHPRRGDRGGGRSRPGVFNLVTGTGPVVGEAIAAHPGVDMVSFTGSTRAGRRVSELAAETVKSVTLELGGKSPNVILDDADLSAAVPDGVAKCFLNSGQTCSALTRMLVPSADARRGGGDRRRGGGEVHPRRPVRGIDAARARWSPKPSATGCATTSRRARRRARSWSPAAPSRPRGSSAATSSARPSSRRSTTR